MMDEETKRPRGVSGRGAGLGEDDLNLRRDYDDAVACVAKCDGIIQDLMGQLKSKNERISDMEDRIARMSLLKDRRIACLEGKVAEMEVKIVRMSLELASSASEASDREDDGDDESRGGSAAEKTGRRPASMNVPPTVRRLASMRRSFSLSGTFPRSSMDMRPDGSNASRRRSWPLRTVPDDVVLDASIAGYRDASDESSLSCSGSLSASISQFLFRDRHHRRPREEQERVRESCRRDESEESDSGALGGASDRSITERRAEGIEDGDSIREHARRLLDFADSLPSIYASAGSSVCSSRSLNSQEDPSPQQGAARHTDGEEAISVTMDGETPRENGNNGEESLQYNCFKTAGLEECAEAMYDQEFDIQEAVECAELEVDEDVVKNYHFSKRKDSLGDSLKDSLGGTLGADLRGGLPVSENSHRWVAVAA